MTENSTKLILSQRYIQKDANTTATLIDLYGDVALIQTEDGLVKMTIDTFKKLFKLILPL